MLVIIEVEVEVPNEGSENLDEEIGASEENEDDQSDNENDEDIMEDEDHDKNDDMLEEEAIGNSFHDMDVDEVENIPVEDIPEVPLVITNDVDTQYRTRSGRVFKRHDYRNINR